MMKEHFDRLKTCAFCRYWTGTKAQRSRQPHYWEYKLCKGDCIKKQIDNVNSIHSCSEFELDSITYYDT